MYLYLTTTGGLLAKAIHMAAFQFTCCGKNGSTLRSKDHLLRAAKGGADRRRPPRQPGRPASVKTVEFASAADQPSSTPRRSNSQNQFSMTQLSTSASMSTLRRNTWQTKGGAGGGGGGSANSILVGNGSINTLCSNGSEDVDDRSGGNFIFNSLARPKDLLLPLLASAVLVALYVVCGALLLSEAQGWTAGEALYFCFVALCTVGFGGLRPEDPHLFPCVAYLFFGLAVISTCFHLIRDEVRSAIVRRRRAAAILRQQQRGSLMSSLESISKARCGGIT